jgi:hypothetical protein
MWDKNEKERHRPETKKKQQKQRQTRSAACGGTPQNDCVVF